MALSLCCPITGNLLQDVCGQTRGGLISEIYVTCLRNITSITSSTTDKSYDAIVMEIDPLTTDPYTWYRIQFKKGTAGLNNELTGTNNRYTNQSIDFSVAGLSVDGMTVLEQFATGEAVFIAKDARGLVHLLGRVSGLTCETLTVGTGAADDDFYGSVIRFSGAETEFSNFITAGTTIEVLNVDGVTIDTVTL